MQEWEDLDPEDRPTNFIPKKHDNLRSVGAYDRFLLERFERCLDLYLCPRMKKNKIQIDPESLVPKLPSPEDLKPFPSQLAVVYKGHTDKVRCISVDPSGVWLASGSEDKTVCIFEVSTGRCFKTFKFDASISNLKWNPNKSISLLAITLYHFYFMFEIQHSSANQVCILNPKVARKEITSNTETLISNLDVKSSSKQNVEWKLPNQEDLELGHVVNIQLNKVSFINLVRSCHIGSHLVK